MSRNRVTLSTSIALAAAGAWQFAGPAEGRQNAAPDVIYYNGKVVTVDDQFSYAQAVAITGDKFTAVGHERRPFESSPGPRRGRSI